MGCAARALADWSTGFEWSDVPAEDRALVGLRVLDTIGLALVARGSEPGRIAVRLAERHGGTPEATLAGSATRLPASWAAFGHAVMAHSNDFDDTFPDSVVHPGSVVVSTALAVAEATGASPGETAAAITAGYEVAARSDRLRTTSPTCSRSNPGISSRRRQSPLQIAPVSLGRCSSPVRSN